ncbi:MAG: SDR family NAD(P)-dependent oxidoreductase [Candidatus Kapabacteria bacterium]|nr:SDR family NAD(P)-dependent oxidoreductase [Candidatus Kapabacteria bacterium]
MTILLTGARGELGRIVHQYLIDNGVEVVGADRDVVDLSSDEDCRRFVSASAGRITGVVHLVGGILAGEPIFSTPASDVEYMMLVNFTTTFNVLRAAMPLLIANGGGSIITIGAKAVLQPTARRAAYAASKAAVVSLTLSAAEEGRVHGVRANCIVPDVIRTPANMTWGTEEEIRSWVHPEEIAEAIYELLQPRSAISGTVIPLLQSSRRQ